MGIPQMPRPTGLVSSLRQYATYIALGATVAQGLQVTFTDQNSVKQAAGQIAFDLMTYYQGNVSGNAPGLLPDSGQAPHGYFWWEGGSMFATMIDYWQYTGDSTYNDVTSDALLFQTGPLNNYEPQNQTFDLGNDDQAFWGMAAMTAAEEVFMNPPKSKPQWLALAQAVYNRQVPRWDQATCGGGLRWQFNQFNAGFTYKSTIANTCLMNLAARLYYYTGDTQYLDEATKLYDWVKRVGLIDSNYNVFDGTSIDQNCSEVNRLQWTYNVGIVLDNVAYLYNATNGDQKWLTEVQGFLKATDFFFQNNVMVEKMCEQIGNCNTDQLSYKSLLIRWMAQTAKLVPSTADQIYGKLQTTFENAAASCNCGDGNTQCSFSWVNKGQCDGNFGIGQQLNALQAVQVNLESQVAGPVTAKTGGTSQGDADAGKDGDDTGMSSAENRVITTGDKAGAGILTTLVVIAILGGAVWMII